MNKILKFFFIVFITLLPLSLNVENEVMDEREPVEQVYTGWHKVDSERDSLKLSERKSFESEKLLVKIEEIKLSKKAEQAKAKRLAEKASSDSANQNNDKEETVKGSDQKDEAKSEKGKVRKKNNVKNEVKEKVIEEKENVKIAKTTNKVETSKEVKKEKAVEKPVKKDKDNNDIVKKDKKVKENKNVEENKVSNEEELAKDGFAYKGHHYPIKSFSGSGRVPANTPYIYQWTAVPSHYLIERVSPAGNTINSLGIGSKVTVNGKTYTITNVETDVENSGDSIQWLDKHPSNITFQTCQTNRDSNGLAYLKIWYAQ